MSENDEDGGWEETPIGCVLITVLAIVLLLSNVRCEFSMNVHATPQQEPPRIPESHP